MVGQVFLPPYRHTQFVYLEPHLVTAWKREHGPGVVRGVVEVEYLFRYRVQGDERLHVGLLPVDADVTPAVRRPADMVRMEQHDVHIRQTGERRKQECPPAQFLQGVKHGCFEDGFQFRTADVPVLRCGLLLVFHVLQRVGTEYLIVHGKVHQFAQPAEALVDLLCAEILVALHERLVGTAEVLRDVGELDVLLAQRGEVFFQVFLVLPRMAVCGRGVYLL